MIGKRIGDDEFMLEAIREAEKAARIGNLPIGSVVAWGDQIIARAGNAVMNPSFHPGEHSEIIALRSIPAADLTQSRMLTLYTTLEPCVMCLGAIVLHRIGRVVFGAEDPNRGAGYLLPEIAKRYPERYLPVWHGPTHSAKCDDLFRRADSIYRTVRSKD